MDDHVNFGAFLVVTPPSPAVSGTELVVSAVGGAVLPAVPFNMTVAPADAEATVNNAEIVRVTAAAGLALTIERAQEGTSARTIVAGDRIDNAITVKVVTDLEEEVALRPKLVAVPATKTSPGVHPSYAVNAFYRYETIADDTWKRSAHSDF